MPALTKNEMRDDHLGEARLVRLAARPHAVEHGDGGGERIGKLLHRRRAGLLQMVGADVHRIPLRRLAGAEKDEILGEPERRIGRKNVGAAREIFLDDVVLRGPLKRGARRALLVRRGDIERHQPGRGGVDRHRRVHRGDRNLIEERSHIAEMGDGHADLADLALRQRMVAVEPGLGRQVEGDRKAGLALGEVLTVKPVRLARRRMARVGAENPRLVLADGLRLTAFRHSCLAFLSGPAHGLFVRSTIAENGAPRHNLIGAQTPALSAKGLRAYRQ